MSEERLDRLYELLPAVYRQRDADEGYPLRALLQVVSEQVNLVEDDITQLYENWFIETCEDWVVPYIGDLVGYRLVHEAGEPGEVTTEQGHLRNKILVSRAEVANTVRYRRRKGTLALLELLARDVAGWPARAVEYVRLLAHEQGLNHLQPASGTADIRQMHPLDHVDDPFTALAHTVDVRRPNSARSRGFFNLPSVALFVWRLRSYPVTGTSAYMLEEAGPYAYTFSVLGNDAPLFTKPEPEETPTGIASEQNLPLPLTRRALETHGETYNQATALYYGPEKSLAIWAPNWPRRGAPQPIPAESIIPADLTDWEYRTPRNYVAVDPERGRIAFPPGQLPRRGVYVLYHYGFSDDVGGGEYDRPLLQPEGAALYQVCQGDTDCYSTIGAALQAWRRADPRPPVAVVEITDSGVYSEPINITLDAGEHLQVRAANRTRPVIRLLDYMTAQTDALAIKGGAGSRFTLDGLLITGRGLQVRGPEGEDDSPEDDLCEVIIRHTTLVPGWTLNNDCEPQRPSEPSLELINTHAHVLIDHSILGSIQVIADEVTRDPLTLEMNDSILDATGADCDSARCEALGGPGRQLAHAVLTVRRSTVFGRVETHAIELAENSIFMGRIRVARRQHGCVRFSYVTPESRTPQRFNCQPDLVRRAAEETMRREAGGQPIDRAELEALQTREAGRVRPRFNGERYGLPGYCQLSSDCAAEIRRGADDESEMGVFHDLFQPQRDANLRARLLEYTPAGADAGVIYTT